MIVQDKDALQVLKNTIVVYNFFSTEVATIKAEEEKKQADGQEEQKESLITVIEGELDQFYNSEFMVDHMRHLNDVLLILQGAQ